MKQHLKEQVAQLLAHQLVVSESDRVVELVRLLDEIGAQRLVILLRIPFAAGAQVPHQGKGVVE